MKIKAFFFPLLMASFFLCSCSGNNDNDKVRLHKREGIDSTVSLDTVSQLNTAVNYDDCRIGVTLPTCHYCKEAKSILKPRIKEKERVIYEVDYASVYKEAYDTYKNSESSPLYPSGRAKYGTPFYRFYKGGSLKATQESSEISEAFFSDRLAKYTVLDNFYQRNDYSYDQSRDTYVFDNTENYSFSENVDYLGFGTKRLDALLSDGKDKIVLYTWRRCHDCQNYSKEVLVPFRKDHPETKIYFYETDGFMVCKRSEEITRRDEVLNLWSRFCIDHHLSDYPTEDILGNKAGFVPTVVFQSETSYRLSVFANQQDLIRNDDGSLSFKVAFYPELTTIKSQTKLKDTDAEGSSSYQKALKELREKVQEADVRLNRDFLLSCIKD